MIQVDSPEKPYRRVQLFVLEKTTLHTLVQNTFRGNRLETDDLKTFVGLLTRTHTKKTMGL